MKKVLICILIFVMAFVATACGSGEPVPYSQPGTPYDGLYYMDHLNYNYSATITPKKTKISLTFNWKTEDDVTAEFTDEYFLEWTMMEGVNYEPVEPNTTTAMTKSGKYELKPNEKLKINIDVDSYFEDLPRGYYRFVKIFEVKQTDGTKEKRIGTFDFSIGMDD